MEVNKGREGRRRIGRGRSLRCSKDGTRCQPLVTLCALYLPQASQVMQNYIQETYSVTDK